MSADTLPPPPPPVCLLRTYVSRGVKGGTIIAEDVVDLDSHRRRLLDPDGYRAFVTPCRTCGAEVLHAHCFRDRLLRPASPEDPAVRETVRLFRCATEGGCGAVFMVLPAFVARHLWRLWKTVDDVTESGKTAPPTTKRRWLSRLRASAVHLIQALLALGTGVLDAAVASMLQAASTRRDLLERVRTTGLLPRRRAIEGIAAWVHRAEPGLRLM